jgi:hypothetical protein
LQISLANLLTATCLRVSSCKHWRERYTPQWEGKHGAMQYGYAIRTNYTFALVFYRHYKVVVYVETRLYGNEFVSHKIKLSVCP